jgi:peptidoglycan/LPS O-acetylase OafA/YrhL
LSIISLEMFKAPTGLTAGRQYLAECESIRGWAIVLVIFFHYSAYSTLHSPIKNPNPVMAFVYAGNSGVTLFFVLSGFLLSMPWLRGRTVKIIPFYRNRLLRIMPMYFFVVAIGTIYHQQYWTGLQTLLFYNLTPITLRPFGVVLWSLVIEMQFYLVLPILMTVSRKDNYRFIGWALIVASIGAYFYILFSPEEILDPKARLSLQNTLLGRSPNFLAGILCAWMYVKLEPRHMAASYLRGLPAWKGDVFLLLILIILSWQFIQVAKIGISAAEKVWPIRHGIEGFLWAILIYVIVSYPLKMRRLLVNHAMNTLGILAYSLYLLHFPLMTMLISVIYPRSASWFTQPLWQAITVLIGMLMVFVPFLSLKAR